MGSQMSMKIFHFPRVKKPTGLSPMTLQRALLYLTTHTTQQHLTGHGNFETVKVVSFFRDSSSFTFIDNRVILGKLQFPLNLPSSRYHTCARLTSTVRLRQNCCTSKNSKQHLTDLEDGRKFL